MRILEYLLIVFAFIVIITRIVQWRILAIKYLDLQKRTELISDFVDKELSARVNTPDRRDIASQIKDILDKEL